MSLVQLRQQSTHATRDTQHDTCGNLDDAHRLLAEVYHWFTEGFETKDLQEAKALLDELR
jgi:predicted ATPase